MREIAGDLWTFHAAGAWAIITTNGSVRRDGQAVMGRGVALEASQRFPQLPLKLGRVLQLAGNIVVVFPTERLLTLPVKHRWYEHADLRLIEQGVRLVVAIVDDEPDTTRFFPGGRPIYLVRPGCGNGGLAWALVQPVIAPILDDRFVVVERG